MYKYKRNGFTLVELMAVIIIISLIALLTFPNIINQIKKTKKSNNKMIEDVVIEQVKKYVNDNKDELTEDEYCIQIATLIDNDYIKEDLTSINDIKDNKAVQVISGDDDSYKIVDKDKCVPTAVKYLLKKTNPITITNYTDGNIHEMYTFEHEATVQTPALTDYRYIGSDPNNYVEFNNELWRIIGVFETDDGTGNYEKRVKIIRNDTLENKQWNASNVNEWTTSSLKNFLNGTNNGDFYDSLHDEAKKMIAETKYYLGGRVYDSITHYGSALDMYSWERGITVYSGRKIYWIGKIALIYPSDYIFNYALGVDNNCYNDGYTCGDSSGKNNNWVYNSNNNNSQWLLSPISSESQIAFRIYMLGGVGYGGNVNTSFGVRPSLYLRQEVKIISGDGTKDNAYKLSM